MLISSVLIKIVPIVAKPFLEYGMGCFYSQKQKKYFIQICQDELTQINGVAPHSHQAKPY